MAVGGGDPFAAATAAATAALCAGVALGAEAGGGGGCWAACAAPWGCGLVLSLAPGGNAD